MNQSKQPVVSVLTTVYNRTGFLNQCIESILNSSYQDWELIIVDDNSTDDSFQVAIDYQNRDRRIKAYRNNENLGDYLNRNKAASYAKGKYIKYLDADDIIYPHGLELMVDAMELFPEAALGISQEVEEDYDPFPFILTPSQVYKRHFLKKGILDLGPSGTIIRRDVFEELGGFSNTRFISDYEYWLKSTMLYPLIKIQGGLVFWRRHEEQEYRKGHLKNEYVKLSYLVNYRILKDEKCPLNRTDNKHAIKRTNFNLSRTVLNLALKKFMMWRSIQLVVSLKKSPLKIILAVLPWSVYKRLPF